MVEVDPAPAGLPLGELSRWILAGVPGIVLTPQGPIFLLMVLVVGLQYRRLAAMEAALLGRPRRPAVRLTLTAVLYGLVGGVLGSYLIVLLGVALSHGDLALVWPVALLLALFHPRLLCFSYAAGLVGLASLALGEPRVNVPGLVALVAVLHVVEGILVLASGGDAAVPVTLRRTGGQVVGGFAVQRFWPVPVTALLWAAVPEPLRGAGLPMPEWWPLFRPPGLDATGLDVVMVPAAAALGYADLAVAATPEERSRRTGLALLGYSLALLVLAWGAARVDALQWAAAAAAPGLHEWMIRAGRRRELEGEPAFAAPSRGVRVMEVLPGGRGAAMGLRRGDVVLAVNGAPVTGRRSFLEALRTSSWYLELEGLRDGLPRRWEHRGPAYEPGALGVLTAPEPDDPPLVDPDAPGPLLRLLRAWARRRG